MWVLVPLLLLWESAAHVVRACSLAKTEHQPQRARVPYLPPVFCFQLVAGTSVCQYVSMSVCQYVSMSVSKYVSHSVTYSVSQSVSQ